MEYCQKEGLKGGLSFKKRAIQQTPDSSETLI